MKNLELLCGETDATLPIASVYLNNKTYSFNFLEFTSVRRDAALTLAAFFCRDNETATKLFSMVENSWILSTARNAVSYRKSGFNFQLNRKQLLGYGLQ